jgi:hypothetical protein
MGQTASHDARRGSRRLKEPQYADVPTGESVHEIEEHGMERFVRGLAGRNVDYGVPQHLQLLFLMRANCDLGRLHND